VGRCTAPGTGLNGSNGRRSARMGHVVQVRPYVGVGGGGGGMEWNGTRGNGGTESSECKPIKMCSMCMGTKREMLRVQCSAAVQKVCCPPKPRSSSEYNGCPLFTLRPFTVNSATTVGVGGNLSMRASHEYHLNWGGGECRYNR